MKKLNESNARKAYEVEFRDDRNDATSSIDTVFADGNYTAEDYIEDCMLNADDEWNEMLSHGEVILHEIDLQESLFEDTKDVSIDKMSKKDRKAFYDKQRNVWGRSPVTKTKPSDKIYDRKKFKKDDLNESEGEKRTIEDWEDIEYVCWDDNKIKFTTENEEEAISYANNNPYVDQVIKCIYDDPLKRAYHSSPAKCEVVWDRDDSYMKYQNSLYEEDEVNKDENKNSNKCPNCGRNLITDSTGKHCPVCDKKNNSSEFNTSSISKGAVSEEFEADNTFDKADFEPHNKDEYEFEHDDDIKGIEDIKL